jgi:hypothetical protein
MTRELSLRHWPKDVRGRGGSCRAGLLQCLLLPGTRQRGRCSARQGREGRCGEASTAPRPTDSSGLGPNSLDSQRPG